MKMRAAITAVALALCFASGGCAAGRVTSRSASPLHATPSADASAVAAAAGTTGAILATAATPGPLASSPRQIVGMHRGNLVIYEVATKCSRVLVPGVGVSGVLVIRPGSPWLAIVQPRRWDGIGVTDVALVNVDTHKVWRLSRQANRELSVQPLGWTRAGVLFGPDPVSGDETTHTWELNLATGAVTTSTSQLVAGWKPYGEVWPVPLRVPRPVVDGVPVAGDFWSIGAADVTRDGRWAVAWLQPSWPAPLGPQETFFPTYLLARDRSSTRLPLERPVLFLESLPR